MNQELVHYGTFLKAKYAGFNDGQHPPLEVEFVEGSKFIKVLTTTYGSTGVHSFIVKNDMKKFKAGDILKAASYKAPAQNFARGNVFTKEYGKISWTGA